MARQYRTGLIIEGDASGGIRAIRATEDSLSRLNGGFQRGGREANRYGRQITQTDRTLAAIRRTAMTAATALASVFAVRSLQNQINFADELQKTRDRIGASTEALSQYNFVASMAGVELSTLTTAWQRQTRRINEAARGTGVASAALERLGLDAKALASLRPEEQFEKIAEAMESVADEGERVALAQKIWDSGGVRLLQITNQGAAAMREMRQEADRLGLTITDDTANNMAAFNDEISRVKFALQGLTATMLAEFIPSLTSGITTVNEWVQAAGGAEQVLGTVYTAAQALAVLLAGRYVGAFAAATAAKVAATQQSIAYQMALARMAGVSTTVVASQAALAASVRGVAGALTLVGGPAGAAVIAVGALFYFREELGFVDVAAKNATNALDDNSDAIRDGTAAALDATYDNLINSLEAVSLQAQEAMAQLTELEARQAFYENSHKGMADSVAGAVDQQTQALAGLWERQVQLQTAIRKNREARQQATTADREGARALEDIVVTADAASASTATAASSSREAEKAADDQARALDTLLDRLFPLEAAQRRYREELELLNEVNWSERTLSQAVAQERLAEAYRQTISSMGGFDEAFNAYPGLFDPQPNEEEEGGYWQRWLEGAENAFTDFDQMAANTAENFQRGFGNAFESMVFDSNSAGDALRGMMQGIARSVVNTLGQMAAQWLAYQAVQLLVGRTTQASAVSTVAGNSQAGVFQAGINAFASTAAIPIVGPAMAPAAMTAAIAATQPLATAAQMATLTGMSHAGVDRIPKEGTWLLDQGQRVMMSQQATELDQFLAREKRAVNDSNGGRSNVQIDVEVINQGQPVQATATVERLSDDRFKVRVLQTMREDLASGASNSYAEQVASTYGMKRGAR